MLYKYSFEWNEMVKFLVTSNFTREKNMQIKSKGREKNMRQSVREITETIFIYHKASNSQSM